MIGSAETSVARVFASSLTPSCSSSAWAAAASFSGSARQDAQPRLELDDNLAAIGVRATLVVHA
jgi:hypothetical protein